MRSLTLADGSLAGVDQGRWIPVPETPIQPVLSTAAFFPRGKAAQPTLLDEAPAAYVTAGRIAIGLALKLTGLKPGDKVLIPAYHCSSMVEPLACVGAEPLFYRLRSDLAADLDDIASKIDGSVRALMACHYFGFPQELEALRALCDERGLKLIEDCAHSLFGTYQGKPLGAFGDYATFSLTKFYPVRDGGALVARDSNELAATIESLSPQSAFTNLRALLDSLEQPLDFGRLPALRPLFGTLKLAKQLLKSARKATSGGGAGDQQTNPAQLRGGREGEFPEEWLHIRCATVSRLTSSLVSRRRLVENRRAHYRRLLDAFSDLPGCRALLPEMGDNVVPYMFALWVDDLREAFPILEDKGVPMQRFGQFLWRGIGEETCSTSAALAQHCLQLPCHQDLREEEMEEMIATVRFAISGQTRTKTAA